MTFVRVIFVIRLSYKYRRNWCLAFCIGILVFWVDANLWIKQPDASNCAVLRCDIENSIDSLPILLVLLYKNKYNVKHEEFE